MQSQFTLAGDKLTDLLGKPHPDYGRKGRNASASSAPFRNDMIVQRVLRDAKPHVTKDRYIKVFDPPRR
jgi:hypothetical protein